MKTTVLLLLVSSLFVTITNAQVTYTVKVPEGTKACFIAGEFNTWTQQEMNKVNDSVYTIYIATATTGSQYKYCSGPSWDYVEKAADGSELANRTYSANDVVARWLAFWFPAVQPLPSYSNNSDVMIQGFSWTSWSTAGGFYNNISAKATELKNAGINVIWMPPPSDALGNEGYLPRELYQLNSAYGTQQELINAITNLHNNGVKVVADIVVNHRVGTADWADFTNPTWGCWAVTADDEWKNNGGTPCGAFDTGEGFEGGRDLDHTNSTVQHDIIAWMRFLKTNIGFDGWRYDYAKGFTPVYFEKYNDSTLPYVSIGEFFDGDLDKVRNWLNGVSMKSTAFDFPLKFTLGQAVLGNYSLLKNGATAAGLMGQVPCNSVTFLDNHDTYRTNGQTFPAAKVLEGYAYLLTHPGIPMLFRDHYFDVPVNNAAINTLISIRRKNNITCSSVLSIQQATTNEYAAIIDDKVALRLGTGNWVPAGLGWETKASGVNYTVWENNTGLPVTLNSIKASWINGKDVSVKWITATEINANRFEVQKSIDGYKFETIGNVPATGNSNVSRGYEFSDIGVNNNFSSIPKAFYYRIKMIDADGKFSFSAVVQVLNAGRNIVSLSPNPAKNNLYVQGLDPLKSYPITITNSLGASSRLLVKAGKHNIDISALPAGVYFIRIEGQTMKFIKKD